MEERADIEERCPFDAIAESRGCMLRDEYDPLELTPVDFELRMRRLRCSMRYFSAVRASCISSICSS
jgi:hypothetical protein